MFSAWRGRMCLFCLSHALIAVWACFVVTNHSASKISRLSVSLNLSLYPFSLGEPQSHVVISKYPLHRISFVPLQFLLKRVLTKFVALI